MQYTQQEAHFLVPSEFYPVHCAGWKVISKVSLGEDLQGPEFGIETLIPGDVAPSLAVLHGPRFLRFVFPWLRWDNTKKAVASFRKPEGNVRLQRCGVGGLVFARALSLGNTPLGGALEEAAQ